MPTIPAPAAVAVTRASPLFRLCVLLGALAVAGCGAAGLPSPTGTSDGTDGPATVPAASPVPSNGAVSTPSATPRPTEQPGPPMATLVVVGGGAPIRGELGSYVWDGAGSDAPWIVPPEHQGVRAGGPYAVAVVPPLAVASWEAAWARVDADQAGDPAGAASGDGGPIAVPGPGAIGTWSLKVDIRFRDGNNAAWYWRVEVLP